MLEVGLEPSTSLRSRLEGIGKAAVEVVAGGAGVAGTIALATGLDPNEGIEEGMAGVGRRASAEAGALSTMSVLWAAREGGADQAYLGVAPVTPRLLAGRLLAVAASISDEVGREATSGEQRAQGLDVVLLVVVAVALGVRRGRGDAPGVVVGNVGSQTTDGGGLAGTRVDAGIQVGCGLNVGGPAEPAGMASIEVHAHVGEVELLQGIDGQLLVGGGRSAALRNVHVGDHVGEGVGLDDQDGADVGVLHENLADGVNVRLVVGGTSVRNRKFSVGGSGGAEYGNVSN